MANPKAAKNRPQNWRTPQPLFLELQRRFGRQGFTLDAAADWENRKCGNHLSEEEDALAADTAWGDAAEPSRVWINPPLKDIRPWVAKAHAEVEEGNAEVVVLLLPARTGSGWFHDYCLPYAHVEFLRGRVAFIPPPSDDATLNARKAPFEDSMVVVFSKPLCPGSL